MDMFSRKRLAIAIATALSVVPVYASVEQDEGDEFNASFLHSPNGQTINVDRFRYKNEVLPGEYLADITLNQKPLGQYSITFIDERNGRARLCIDSALLAMFDIKSDAIEKKPTDGECLSTFEVIPKGKFTFDLSSQKLNLELPQELTIVRPKGYIAPSRWEKGIPALFTHYRLNYYQTKRENEKESEHYTYLGLRSGATWNGWTVRHRGSYTDRNYRDKRYQSYDTYVQHDVDTLQGRLTLGDFYTQGRVADSISLRGIALASDPRMLPNSQQGFAPTVKGVANTNAKVTIRQNGNIIYETTVPPGPFVIDDIYPSGYAGDLLVEITENNGSVRSFIVPYTSGSGLMRQGQLWYEVAAGHYRQNSHLYPVNVFQTSMQYGLNNVLTLNGGATIADHYYSGNLGLIWQNPLGTFETKATLSHLKNRPQSPSFKIIYSKNLMDSQTYLYATAEYFLGDYDYSLSDTILDHDNPNLYSKYAIKEKYRLSLNQPLGDSYGNLYLAGTANRYRQGGKLAYGYQVGYSVYLKNIDFQIGYWREQREDQRQDNQFYANFSIPFSIGHSQNYLRNAYTRDTQNRYIAQTSLYGTAGEYDQFNYGGTVSKQENLTAYSVNAGYDSPFIRLGVTHSHSPYFNQRSYEASGAVVAHPYGITLSSVLGETFAIIHAKGAKNARIKNKMNHRLDYWGNAIVPYLSPYRINSVGIDIEDLPEDIEISATSKDVIPRANTASLVKLETQSGTLHFFDVSLHDNTLPPIGAEIFDYQGRLIGHVGQDGRAFFRTEETSGTLRLVWGPSQKEQCKLSYAILNSERKVRCLPEH